MSPAPSAPEPRWVGRLVADTVQHDLVSTHGGLPGLRDEGLLEAALAAAYAYGVARNHPYNDGNKRIAFVVAAVFAELNGYRLDAPEPEAVDAMLRLAAGEIEEEALADWLRGRLTEIGNSHSR